MGRSPVKPEVDASAPAPDSGKVRFHRGMLITHSGLPVQGHWAETGFGTVVLRDGESPTLKEISRESLHCGELLCTVDLEGLDRHNTEFIVSRVLAGRLLERPGIGEQEDSLLFVLVNEALHVLQRVAAADPDATGPTDEHGTEE